MEHQNQKHGEFNQGLFWKILLILGISLWFFIGILRTELGPKETIESINQIPDYDHSRVPYYFDYKTEKWVYFDELERRANGYKRKEKVEDYEEIIEEKLREGIDGYAEETYWGQEYEFNDIED